MTPGEDQISAILNDPEKMSKIMELAQSFGGQSDPPKKQAEPQPKEDTPLFSMGEIDPAMIQRISAIASQSNIDKNQRNLLSALTPYLSKQRIDRLERAMRAAKLAGVATSFLGNQKGL